MKQTIDADLLLATLDKRVAIATTMLASALTNDKTIEWEATLYAYKAIKELVVGISRPVQPTGTGSPTANPRPFVFSSGETIDDLIKSYQLEIDALREENVRLKMGAR